MEYEELFREASRSLSPDDIDAGERALNECLNGIRIYSSIVTWSASAFFCCGGMGALIFLIISLGEMPSELVKICQIFAAFFAGAFLIGVALAARVTTRRHFWVKRPYDADLPQPLLDLLDELASGRRLAFSPSTAPTVRLGMPITPDGTVLDKQIAAPTFRNRWAPLLLSPRAVDCRRVMTKRIFSTINGPVFVAINDSVEDEHRLRGAVAGMGSLAETGLVERLPNDMALQASRGNKLPDTHWLIQIPRDRFPQWQQSVIARGRWSGTAETQMAVVLEAAYEVVLATENPSLGHIAKACRQALADAQLLPALKAGKKAGAPIAEDSLKKFFGDAEDHTYKWVKESAQEFTEVASQ